MSCCMSLNFISNIENLITLLYKMYVRWIRNPVIVANSCMSLCSKKSLKYFFPCSCHALFLISLICNADIIGSVHFCRIYTACTQSHFSGNWTLRPFSLRSPKETHTIAHRSAIILILPGQAVSIRTEPPTMLVTFFRHWEVSQ